MENKRCILCKNKNSLKKIRIRGKKGEKNVQGYVFLCPECLKKQWQKEVESHFGWEEGNLKRISSKL
ncbi:hypothetical protein [Eubacterium sp. An3]|uniref:hypothetical protein n=1 Tax=Eubacterium sp. An3 TaxID=1965628 RepID=UPI000B36F786|nr:hypothetical protein [Eubacterium sp. An3]OUO28483.1 hypothetical protein B5F87_06805 [Eubacterium sp. An3]